MLSLLASFPRSMLSDPSIDSERVLNQERHESQGRRPRCTLDAQGVGGRKLVCARKAGHGLAARKRAYPPIKPAEESSTRFERTDGDADDVLQSAARGGCKLNAGLGEASLARATHAGTAGTPRAGRRPSNIARACEMSDMHRCQQRTRAIS